jgi:hypothetical protein
VSNGGNRPTFVSGGVQQGRIVNITGDFHAEGYNYASEMCNPNGAFYGENPLPNQKTGMTSSNNAFRDILFNASRMVRSGADVGGINLSCKLYRRVS